jgi:hypothetical protein
MAEKKKEYVERLQQIGHDAVLGLEPIIKEKGNQALDVIKEFTNDFITTIFEEKRKKIKK